jgi:hypothetical protein
MRSLAFRDTLHGSISAFELVDHTTYQRILPTILRLIGIGVQGRKVSSFRNLRHNILHDDSIVQLQNAAETCLT